MSSRERTLILKIDDTQLRDAIKKMQAINAGGTSSTGTKKSKGIGGLITMITSNPGILKAVGKLALILAAITIMVKLITKITDRIVDSSPILQTMLKLLQTSITFILRPIGDFIGFFLRPFLIYFLRNVALPMYRLFGPLARTLGTFLGGNLFNNLTFKYDPKTDPFFGTNGIFAGVGETVVKWIDSLKLPSFTDMITKVKGWLDSLKLPSFTDMITKVKGWLDLLKLPSLEQVWKTIGDFGEKLKPIVDSLAPIMIEGLRGLRKIFNILTPLIGPIIEKIVPVITGIADFVLDLVNPLRETFKDIFSVITVFFNGIKTLFDTITNAIRIFFPDFGKDSGSTTTNTTTTNIFGDVNSQEDYNDIFTFEGIVEKSLNSSLSGRG